MQTQSLISDQELVSRYIRGNETAIEVLVMRHKDRIFAYINKYLKDKQLSEDIFQDVFIKVINTIKKGKYNEEGKFLPWVMRIAHNMVIDYFRKNKRMPIADGGEDYDIFDTIKRTDLDVEDKIINDQIQQDVRGLIEFLPKDQKEVLRLRYYCGLSFKEISEETNVSINTALGRMRYALINLRKMVEEKDLNLTLT